MLKLMTFNIRYGLADDGPNSWPNRRSRAARMIRREEPDVIGLQEVQPFQLIQIREDLPEYEAVGVPRGTTVSDDEACTILYKPGLKLLRQETFWLSESPDVPGSQSWDTACTRICTVAAFEGLTVFNCHLDHVSQLARENGLRLIASRVGARSVVMGDFNASESNDAHRQLSGLVETYRAVHPEGPELSTYHGWEPSNLLGEKIDYIYATPDLRIEDAAIIQATEDGQAYSDHFAVTATLGVGDAEMA